MTADISGLVCPVTFCLVVLIVAGTWAVCAIIEQTNKK